MEKAQYYYQALQKDSKGLKNPLLLSCLYHVPVIRIESRH